MTKKSLYQVIYDAILADIAAGRYAPGDKLASEKEIAAQFGVSRITSRKALELLAQDGYIRKQAGLGSFVQPTDANQAASATLPIPEPAPHQPERLLGLLLSGISEVYGNELLHKAFYYAMQEGYELISAMTLDSVEAEKRSIRTMKELGIQGLMIGPVTSLNYNYELVSSIIDGFPTVCVNTLLRGINTCLVGVDNRSAIDQIVDYLMAKGHTRIGFYSSPPSSSMCLTEIYEFYVEAMCRNNLPNFYSYLFTQQQISPNYLFYHGREEDQKKVAEYLSRNKDMTAVITADYRAAVLLKETAALLGMQVPRDLSIVCFFEQKRSSSPIFFHHIAIDEDQLARESVRQLIKQIDTPLRESVRVNVAHRLIEGKSVRDLTAT